jgi:hypothetical protein
MGRVFSTDRRMGEMRGSYRVLVGESERPFGRPKHRWENTRNIIIYLKENIFEDIVCFHLSQDSVFFLLLYDAAIHIGPWPPLYEVRIVSKGRLL